jgi:hypothetical protein
MAYKKPQCNCPDATNKRDKLIGSPYLSETFPSDWSSGFNGIRAKGGYCIHELAVIIYRGEQKQAFPDGIPYEPELTSDIIIESKRKQIFDSDYSYV